MTFENAVRQWIQTHAIDCDSCGKLLTDMELVEWLEYNGCIDVTLQCGWCWQKNYAEFALSMA